MVARTTTTSRRRQRGDSNLARLVEWGVMGNLATLQPMLSLMLWTSIATGKRPFKHGVHGFAGVAPTRVT